MLKKVMLGQLWIDWTFLHPPDKGYLWSGNKDAACRIASDRGGQTLEATPGGKVIDNWEYLGQKFPTRQASKDFWGAVSSKYSRELTGDVTALQTPSKAARGGDIFLEYELDQVNEGLVSGRVTSFKVEPILPEPY